MAGETSVRSFWKGYLRLALVAIPIRLVSAEKAEATPRFHQIDRKTRQRIRYQKVVPGKGEVAREDIVMGYEIEPGNYVLMDEGELDSVRLESRHTIELSQFVDADEIAAFYFERPYYILPDGEVAEEGYRVIRDALKAARKVGIGQLTLRGRENLVALYPAGAGLVLDTLRYDAELKDGDSIFSGISTEKPRADMLRMAEQLVEARTEPFEPSKFRNHYAEAVRDLVRAKVAAGGATPIEQPDRPDGAKVIDFMEALRRSVGGETAAKPDKPPPRRGASGARQTAAAKRPEKKPDKRSGKNAGRSSGKSAPARRAGKR